MVEGKPSTKRQFPTRRKKMVGSPTKTATVVISISYREDGFPLVRRGGEILTS